MDNHFSEEIDLDNIAGEAFFSKFHFLRLFKKIYCKTPHQYLISVRIEAAKLLLAKDLSVMEVSYSVGIKSVTSFAGLFKRITGVTPSSFQRQRTLYKTAIEKTPLRFVPNCFAEKNGWTKNSNF